MSQLFSNSKRPPEVLLSSSSSPSFIMHSIHRDSWLMAPFSQQTWWRRVLPQLKALVFFFTKYIDKICIYCTGVSSELSSNNDKFIYYFDSVVPSTWNSGTIYIYCPSFVRYHHTREKDFSSVPQHQAQILWQSKKLKISTQSLLSRPSPSCWWAGWQKANHWYN